MNFTEGNQLQVALIRHLDPGHHNEARTEFVELQSTTIRRAMLLLEKAMGQTPVVSEETISRLRGILGEELGQDPQLMIEEIVRRRAA